MKKLPREGCTTDLQVPLFVPWNNGQFLDGV